MKFKSSGTERLKSLTETFSRHQKDVNRRLKDDNQSWRQLLKFILD